MTQAEIARQLQMYPGVVEREAPTKSDARSGRQTVLIPQEQTDDGEEAASVDGSGGQPVSKQGS